MIVMITKKLKKFQILKVKILYTYYTKKIVKI